MYSSSRKIRISFPFFSFSQFLPVGLTHTIHKTNLTHKPITGPPPWHNLTTVDLRPKKLFFLLPSFSLPLSLLREFFLIEFSLVISLCLPSIRPERSLGARRGTGQSRQVNQRSPARVTHTQREALRVLPGRGNDTMTRGKKERKGYVDYARNGTRSRTQTRPYKHKHAHTNHTITRQHAIQPCSQHALLCQQGDERVGGREVGREGGIWFTSPSSFSSPSLLPRSANQS